MGVVGNVLIVSDVAVVLGIHECALMFDSMRWSLVGMPFCVVVVKKVGRRRSGWRMREQAGSV
jgi:hypothetical protein